MLFSLLTRLLLWLLIAVIAYAVLLIWIPKKYYTWLGGILIFTLIIVTFFDPTYVVIASLWKLLIFPFTPLGLASILILSGLLHFQKKEIGNPGKQLLWSGFTILVFFSLPAIAYSLASQAEWESINVAQKRLANCQIACPVSLSTTIKAIVLLGQGTTETVISEEAPVGSPSSSYLQITERGDLIFHTAQLFQEAVLQNQDPIVIVTGGQRSPLHSLPESPTLQQLSEAEEIVTILERLGVHRTNLKPALRGDNLYRSAVEVKEILEKQGLQGTPIMLVTSALQMRRAELTFRHLGIEIIPSPTNFITLHPISFWRGLRLQDIIPTADALALSTQVTNEHFATIYYFLRGWLSPF